MDWQKIYNERKMTADEAASRIKSGDYVVIGHAAGEPGPIIDALVAQKDHLANVMPAHYISMGKSEYCLPEMEGHFRHHSWFCGKTSRAAVQENRAEFTPIFFFEMPRVYTDHMINVDVALIQVSKPDKHGYVSCGITADYTLPAARVAKLVIAEVNDQIPRTFGSFMHVSELDCIVETSRPPIMVTPAPLDQDDYTIGEYCATLIEDGSTLQLGIGTMPDAVCASLINKKDLGVHTEMVSDAMLPLIDAGVITGKRKTIHKDKLVCTFLMGTKRLYDFADDNPMVEMLPVTYTNDPRIVAQNYKMVAINGCIEVDLMGQVTSETLGYKQYSGTGGQVDFIRGAAMAEGGKSILVMKSTAKGGKISKIVTNLALGSAVTVSRNDIHYLVTEYGIADLRWKTLRQRATELIKVAHPDFRDQLRDEYEKLYYKLPD
ncbi:MAG: 4-hydroxybutyrate CoA-transferase [Gracilibacteraceae bacterium]|jgi:4-hydroxybutyrate CoA-transferase|nr:4-hydroxybutyrate CoA-transferase [Gracilibacteraceae bacterium]